MEFTNMTTLEQYNKIKFSDYAPIKFAYRDNIATGYADSTKIVKWGEHEYIVSANTEKHFIVSHNTCNDVFSVWFSVDGDTINIERAHRAGREEKADKYLKKYIPVLTLIHSVMKYDRIIKYVSYPHKKEYINGIAVTA